MGKAHALDALEMLEPDRFQLGLTLQDRIDEVDDTLPCQYSPDHFFPTTELFMAPVYLDLAMAKAACQRCPIIMDCLEYAMLARETDGVWGGTTPMERKNLRRVLLGQGTATTNTEKRLAEYFFARFPELSSNS